jgi:hypothetical protein
MRRSASEIIYNLEQRVARLECQSNNRKAFGKNEIDDVNISNNVKRVLRKKIDEIFGGVNETIKDMIELFLNDYNVDLSEIDEIIDAGQNIDEYQMYVKCKMYSNRVETWTTDHLHAEWNKQ